MWRIKKYYIKICKYFPFKEITEISVIAKLIATFAKKLQEMSDLPPVECHSHSLYEIECYKQSLFNKHIHRAFCMLLCLRARRRYTYWQAEWVFAILTVTMTLHFWQAVTVDLTSTIILFINKYFLLTFSKQKKVSPILLLNESWMKKTKNLL